MTRRDGASKIVNISRKNAARSSLIRPTTLRRARESETVISRKISARSSLIRPTMLHRVSESNTVKLSRTISARFSPIRPGWASGSKTFKISRKISARSSLITPTMLRRTGESKILILSQATSARPSFIASTLLHRASESKEINVVQASSARSLLITPTMFGQDSRSEIVRSISQTISGGEGGRGGVGGAQGQGGNGGNGEGPTLSYYINPAEGFHMPVHIVMPVNDLHAGPPAGMTSEGSPFNVSILSPGGSLKPAPCTPQFNIYVTEKHRREETREDDPSSAQTTRRRRLEEDDRVEDDVVEIIRRKDLSLIHEISCGPGYLLHAGQNKDRAVIVKVFNKSPTVRQQLELTVNLTKELMHSNVLRIKGISALQSDHHFIVYDNGHCVNAEVLLAEALKNDLGRSVTLGFTMIAGVSAGISHLCMQGVWSRSMGVTNFHILVNPEDRFSIIINAPHSQEVETAALQESEDNALIVFNALLDKTLISANRLLHKEQIKRDPAIPDAKHTSAVSANLAVTSASSSQNTQEDLSVPPRREYVWRSMENGWEALVEVSERLTVDLKFHLSRLSRLTRMDGLSAHRCPGYVREEITLATTILESAVVVHDTPSPSEECPVCHEVVGLNEAFLCICGDLTPGSQHTIKCRECKLWSHSDCVGNQKDFICRLCLDSVVAPVPSIAYGIVPDDSGKGPILNHDISGQHFTGINSVHDHPPRGSGQLPFLRHEENNTPSSSESPPTPTLSLSPSEPSPPLQTHESAIRDQREWIGISDYSSHGLHSPHMRGVSPFESSSHSSHPDMYNSPNTKASMNRNLPPRFIEPTLRIQSQAFERFPAMSSSLSPTYTANFDDQEVYHLPAREDDGVPIGPAPRIQSQLPTSGIFQGDLKAALPMLEVHAATPTPILFSTLTRAVTLHGDGDGDDRRQEARAHRLRQLSPYPVAVPSTGQAEISNAMHWTTERVDDFSNQRLESNAQALFTMSLTDDPPSPSIQRNAHDQYSQEGQGHVPGHRHSAATDALRRTTNARRKDPAKRGAYICLYCGNDFTALHNLNFHIKSHLSIKEHKCECGQCGQRFSTPQVLKRHRRRCQMHQEKPSLNLSVIFP